MKCLVRVTACTIALVAIVGTCFVFVPTRASATEYSGTSPSFATGQTWSLDVGWANAGDIITWYWTTSDNLIFSFHRLPSTYYSGLTDYDGIVVDTAGEFVMSWYNNNLFFSATVSYWVAVFTPSFSVTSPSEGAYLNSTTISVQGTADAYADGVLVGPDALHLREADWSGNDWGVDNLVLNEGQNSILVRSYYMLDYYGYKNITYDKTVHVTVDTVPPEIQIVKPLSGGYVAGTIDLVWQCSDSNGIAKREVKVEATDWVTVATDTFTTEVADGFHWIGVRITDVAGNTVFAEVRVFSDTVTPEVWIQQPEMNAKISKDHVNVTWTGGDEQSGLDRYEVQINGRQWIDVGYATSYEFTNLDDVWYSVNVKVVDKSGNEATATTSFGIYTSVWSQNGPYNGIPLYALIVAIIAAALLSVLLYWRKRKGGPAVTSVPKEEPAPGTP